MIDKATVQRIKDAADIVEVVSDYVHLTRRGANYMGLCPFHNERTPSFSVNRRRNFCYCFSCHKGGSPVNFIMEKEGISYHDALLYLAAKYGIKVEERELTDEERQQQTEREGLSIAAERAMKIMETDLKDTEEGRDVGLQYLYHRGVTEEAVKAFHLGYALDKGNYLTEKMRKAGFDTDTLRKLGLTGMSQAGNLYDKYRGRVIFPIMNSSGRVVGFGGRDLKGGPAKYINSPESTLYHKNNELYGIFQAKSEIVRQDKCFLVEGYLDVISMWQSGMQNVVASSGTALTDGQIAIIHRFTQNITLLYDGDQAGIKAALRGINMLLGHKMKVTVLLLPDGDDPDSFSKKHSAEDFRKYVTEHETDIIRFKMDVLSRDMGDSPMKKAAVVNSVVESIACIADDVERTVYIGECCRVLGVDEASVASAVQKARFKIIEEQKRERERRRLEKDFPAYDADNRGSSQLVPNPADTLQQDPTQQTGGIAPDADHSQQILTGGNGTSALEEELIRRENQKRYPLKPLENSMIQLLIRYGYMNFRNSDADEDIEDLQSEIAGDEIYAVVDFVNDELEADHLEFSVEEYGKVFDALLDHFDEFLDKLDEFKAELENRLAKELNDGLDAIAQKTSSLSFEQIRREEEKLKEKIEEMRENELKDFSRLYPGDYLASHQDAEIRKVANEMINEKYVLSNIYKQSSSALLNPNVEQLVIRAMTEWKSEILNNHLKELLEKFRQNAGTDPEKDRETMAQINHLMTMRSRVAKDIGDRIISPRRR